MSNAAQMRTLAHIRALCGDMVRQGQCCHSPEPADVLNAILHGALGVAVETLGARRTYFMAQSIIDDLALQAHDERARAVRR